MKRIWEEVTETFFEELFFFVGNGDFLSKGKDFFKARLDFWGLEIFC